MESLKKALDDQIMHKENIKKLSFKEPAKTHDGTIETHSFSADHIKRPNTVADNPKQYVSTSSMEDNSLRDKSTAVNNSTDSLEKSS